MRSLKPFFVSRDVRGSGCRLGAVPKWGVWLRRLVIYKIANSPLQGSDSAIFIFRFARPPPHLGNAPRGHPLPLTGYWEGTAAAGSAWGEDNCIGGNV